MVSIKCVIWYVGKAMQRYEIKALTGLRGVAAIAVVIYHFANVARPPVNRPSFAGSGYLAVDLFFILSGFVMAMSYGDRFRKDFSWPKYGEFLWRRFCKVYPAYIVVTLLAVVATHMHLMYRCVLAACVASNTFLIQNWGVGFISSDLADRIVFPSWSLSTEAAAYFLFPALVMLVSQRRSLRAFSLIAGACYAILIGVVVFAPSHPFSHLDYSSGSSLFPLGRCILEFTVGLCLYNATTALESRRMPPYLGIALAGAAFVMWFIPAADILEIPVFAGLIFVCARSEGALSSALSSRPIHFLGLISYSLYLVHGPSLDLTGHIEHVLGKLRLPHTNAISMVLLFCGDIVASYILYEVIEKRGQQLLRNLPSLIALRRSVTADIQTSI